MAKQITQRTFGMVNGTEIIETVMENKQGMRVATCTYGATITEIAVADRAGVIENVVCGFNSVEGYVAQPQFFGATIGPFAGRLENSEVVLNGQAIQVEANDGAHLLHGGQDGFHQCIWAVETSSTENSTTTTYTLTYSGNFPGIMDLVVTFTLLDSNELIISYNGRANQDTLLNCTNHSYFNLSGNLKRTVHNHLLKIPANTYIPLTEDGVPTGEYRDVANTPFDFTKGKPLATVLQQVSQGQVASSDIDAASLHQLEIASDGLDHPFILLNGLIELRDEESGRVMTITSEDRALVVYTGNKIGEGYAFKEAPAQNFLGVCLEEQNVPNSVKYPYFPSSLLTAGQSYQKKTIYRFTTC